MGKTFEFAAENSTEVSRNIMMLSLQKIRTLILRFEKKMDSKEYFADYILKAKNG
jgi:hypothetical protein